MRETERQSRSNLATDDFDSSVVEAAWNYHRQIGGSHAKGNVPVELAAFIAGACWARQVLLGDESRNGHGPSGPGSSPSTGAGGGSSASKKTF
jgi:hypothetical protein